MGERETDEWTATVRAALAKLDGARERNEAIERQLAALYADVKNVADALSEVRVELVHLDGRSP